MLVQSTSGIKAMPISRLATNFAIGGALINVEPPHLMKESNLIIEPITAKNEFGLDITVAYKATATIYFINDDSAVQEYFKHPNSGIGIYQLNLGNTGAFTREGNSSVFLGGNSSKATATIRDETTQGWLRSVLRITAISREAFKFIDNNTEQ